jgi:hypothetical protein
VGRDPLDAVPLWLLFVAVAGFSVLAMEGGYRLGRWRHAWSQDEQPTPVGAMVGSVVGLFAFLLAFTFGLVAARYEARRQAVLDEANAIGTTYLRTRLLPEPQRGASAALLREYVNVRVQGAQTRNVQEAVVRSEELQGQLWAEAGRAADVDRGPITGLYVQSLNQMIDMHAVRVQAGIRSRIPTSIWVGLFALSLLSMASVGYQSGLSATRRSPEMAVLVLAFAGVMFLIADMDRPGEGFLTVSQQATVDLKRAMDAPQP